MGSDLRTPSCSFDSATMVSLRPLWSCATQWVGNGANAPQEHGMVAQVDPVSACTPRMAQRMHQLANDQCVGCRCHPTRNDTGDVGCAVGAFGCMSFFEACVIKQIFFTHTHMPCSSCVAAKKKRAAEAANLTPTPSSRPLSTAYRSQIPARARLMAMQPRMQPLPSPVAEGMAEEDLEEEPLTSSPPGEPRRSMRTLPGMKASEETRRRWRTRGLGV